MNIFQNLVHEHLVIYITSHQAWERETLCSRTWRTTPLPKPRCRSSAASPARRKGADRRSCSPRRSPGETVEADLDATRTARRAGSTTQPCGHTATASKFPTWIARSRREFEGEGDGTNLITRLQQLCLCCSIPLQAFLALIAIRLLRRRFGLI